MQKDIVYIRVVAMVMVVFYHCLCFYTYVWGIPKMYINFYAIFSSVINSIDMPAFVFISGYLYAYLKCELGHYHNNKKFLVNKTRRLIVPYLIVGALLYLIDEASDPTEILKGISHLWFLLMLFEVFIFVQFTEKIWNRMTLKQSLVLCCVVFCLMIVLNKVAGGIRWLCFNNFCRFLPVFYMGLIIRKFHVEDKFTKSLKMFLLLIFSLIILCIISYFYVDKISIFSHESISLAGQSILALIVIFCSKIILRKCIIDNSSTPQGLWRSFDKNSMGIYIIHHIILIYFVTYSVQFQILMINHYIMMPIVTFSLLLVISWILSDLLHRSKLKFILGDL